MGTLSDDRTDLSVFSQRLQYLVVCQYIDKHLALLCLTYKLLYKIFVSPCSVEQVYALLILDHATVAVMTLARFCVDMLLPDTAWKMQRTGLEYCFHHVSYNRPRTYQLQRSATEHSPTCKSHSHMPQKALILSVTAGSY
jgi:hypothetical protein